MDSSTQQFKQATHARCGAGFRSVASPIFNLARNITLATPTQRRNNNPTQRLLLPSTHVHSDKLSLFYAIRRRSRLEKLFPDFYLRLLLPLHRLLQRALGKDGYTKPLSIKGRVWLIRNDNFKESKN